MPLPTDFVASATALECYATCPRRFRHRYIDRLPAAGPDETTASRMRRGTLFHRLVVWDDLGLDTSLILQAEDDPGLVEVWASYCQHREALFEGYTRIQHDQVLTARCGSVAVQARLDALAFGPDGGVTIFDWKTGLHPDRPRLSVSPQSKVYPYVVWNTPAVHDGLDDKIHARINLVYWFPDEPQDPLRIQCDTGHIEASSNWLSESLDTIMCDDLFEMTPDRRTCRTCEYLAHCGVRAEAGGEAVLDEDYYVPFFEEDDSLVDMRWDL